MLAALILGLAIAAIAVLWFVVARRRLLRRGLLLLVAGETLEARLDAVAQDIGAALERLERGDRALDLRTKLDDAESPADVLDGIVGAAAAVPGVDAAAARGELRGDRLLAVSGIGHALAVELLPDRLAATAAPLELTLRGIDEPGAGGPRFAVALPLAADGRALGVLVALASRREALSPTSVADLESIARAGGPALLAPVSIHALSLDPATGLGDRTALIGTLARDVGRARRRRLPLALLLVEVEGVERVEPVAAEAVAVDVATRIRDASAPTGFACRMGPHSFGVILRDASRIEAESLLARLGASLGRTPPAGAGQLSLVGGIAHLGLDGAEDALTLLVDAYAGLHAHTAAHPRPSRP